MSDIRLVAGATPTRITGDDQFLGLRGIRDGSAVTVDWVTALAMEGRVITARAGSATTPITFGAGTIDTTEPDFALSVPTGTMVVLLEILVHMETFGTTAIFEGMASTGTGGVFGTDTDLVVGTTITNSRTDNPYASLCSAGVASNADATYMTANVSEFWRFGANKVVDIATADDDSSQPRVTFKWSYKDSGPQVLVGNGTVQLMVFAASQAGTGFIEVKWAELPSTMVS